MFKLAQNPKLAATLNRIVAKAGPLSFADELAVRDAAGALSRAEQRLVERAYRGLQIPPEVRASHDAWVKQESSARLNHAVHWRDADFFAFVGWLAGSVAAGVGLGVGVAVAGDPAVVPGAVGCLVLPVLGAVIGAVRGNGSPYYGVGR